MDKKLAYMWLIGIAVIVFFFQMFTGGVNGWFTSMFLLNSTDVLFRPWILITHMFLHSGFEHLFFNMYGLFLFGMLLEPRIGAKRLLSIFFVGGVVAALVSIIIHPFLYSGPLYALGASAGLLAVIGTLIMLMPNLQLLFFFIIPMPLWVAGIIWAAIDVFGIFFPSGVGNVAHLIGMACGLGYGYYLKGKKQTYHKKFSKKTYMNEEDIDEYLRTGRL